MSKKLIVASVAMAFAAAAQAQSNTTLYGLIDTGITYVSNQGGYHGVAATSGNLSGNR